jgi:C-terminal processing protease CtpA/Prc
MSMSARAQSTGSQSGRGAPLGKPAGVGIYFQESGSDIVVNHLIRGGSAERSGKVVAGDIIVAIDNNDVRFQKNYIIPNFRLEKKSRLHNPEFPTGKKKLVTIYWYNFFFDLTSRSWRIRVYSVGIGP